MAEFSGKKPHQQSQRMFKGCSCKKSQCIKNYCDCYQSMIICTKYCKCIGCRNTEQRETVAPKTETTKKNNDTELPVGVLHTKMNSSRQSAAAIRNIHSLTTHTQMQHQPQQPQQLKQKQQTAAQHATQQPKQSSQVVPPTPAPEVRNLNILMPEICDAVLASLLAQEEEAEQVGLDVQERAQLLINEMERCLSVIYKASLPV